jgi:hypothetical protein
MLNRSRLWVALLVSAVASVSVACSSPSSSPPAAPVTGAAAPSTSSPVPAPSTSSLAPASALSYCASLAAAYRVKPPTGKTTVKAQATFGKLLIPAAKAAAADGKADVAKLLNLLAAMNSDPLSVTAEQAGTAFADIAKVAPVVQKDCGISLMQ